MCSIEIFEKRILERYNLYLELYKFSKQFTEGNARMQVTYLCSYLLFLYSADTFSDIISTFPSKLATNAARGYQILGSHL